MDDAALLAASREEAGSASGPGGQHANKTASVVRLVWLADPSIHAQSGEERERGVNRRRALRRLRLQLALR
ncbi:MAG: peptide chain release factor family protein, partial [Planctomycetota bacterium]